MKLRRLAQCLLLALLIGCNAEQELFKASVEYTIEDGIITLEEPERTAEQESMIEFRAEPLDTVRVGFVGLGMRGPGAVERFTYIEGTAIKALCDKYAERAEACQAYLERAGMPRADIYSGETPKKASP